MTKFKLNPARAMLGILVGCAAVLFGGQLQAQPFDLFGMPRFIVLAPSAIITNTPNTSTAVFSNAPVDIHGYDGVADIIFFATNSPYASGKTIYAYLLGSNDDTNWFNLTNCAVTTSYTYNITNLYLGNINNVATNTYLIPGTITTPTAGTAGFASTYLAPATFNSGGTLLTNVAGGIAILGYPVSDGPRYIQVAYTITGTAPCAFNVGCVMIARKNAGNFFY
ncbi:MAG TPA: hypothetical protein VG028_13285 [Terriglobia bacterium]|nr:hypothetical protein [Terriglobia bacterium]